MKPELDLIIPGDDVVVSGVVTAVTYYEGESEPAELHVMTHSGVEFIVIESDAAKIKDSSV